MSFENVQAKLKGTELEKQIIICKESSATVELAAAALGRQPGEIAKTLSFVLKDGSPILVVVMGTARIDNHKYKDRFGCKASMIPFDDVPELIGHAVGGVCPFAVNEGCEVFLDDSLKRFEIVYPAAGNAASAVELTIPELEKYSGYKEWCDVCK